jgi:hypothetical protein
MWKWLKQLRIRNDITIAFTLLLVLIGAALGGWAGVAVMLLVSWVFWLTFREEGYH